MVYLPAGRQVPKLGYVPARTERKQYSILAFNFGTFGRAFSWNLPAGRQAATD